MHRLMGYKMIPYLWLEMICDGILLLFVLLLWKPLVITLIYMELWIKVSVLFLHTLIKELMELVSPVTLVIGTVFMLPNVMLFTNITIGMYLRKILINGPANIYTYEEMKKCMYCISSPSLLGRYISGLPSAQLMTHHQLLDEISTVYRVFKYII